ncbi:S8 family peptidase [Mucilaginibacter gotjawali]|uniref:Major intracellular serine protease n=2 Tax=Mucilaginibacter gotjawali TaxID=1550579 RepID=A0A120MYW4_9SPHI|nr:S8/S53 family peptidase [Mucilaginibacter gotjawali]MBB3053751.1 subtilisin [Mucilaginibacter gotjawali]BAU54011.1 Major intracellular serine protease precursor [Mucilaginibacter gotjawali]
MTQYIVTADLLNVRRETPQSLTDPNVVGTVNKGHAFDGTPVPANQLTNPDLGPFIKDNISGNVVSGAFVMAGDENGSLIPTSQSDIDTFNNNAKFPPTLINWNSRVVKLPAEIRNTLGSGIRVAVLDTGIERTHIDLAQNLVDSVDFTDAEAGDSDQVGHGTEMASLIAASAYFAGIKGITGVAPQAKIYSAKVMYDEGGPGDNDPKIFLSVENGLSHVLQKNVDIVNMSIGRPPAFPFPDVKKGITNMISQNTTTVFFAATKEISQINSASDLLDIFPANIENVIPVCTLTKELVNEYWDQLPIPLIIIPVFKPWACDIQVNQYYSQNSGSSISTALMAGITALILSHNSSVIRTKQGIIDELKKYTSNIDEAFSNIGNEIHLILKS